MASRLKEDEKNERIIRGLLKLTPNKRCINCNSLGTQYVCTNFWTFVCTNCSGIHREFTHRVKSISMAKFTAQEVSALQERGNQHAKEIYFKEWDPQRHSLPDSSNVDRLRDFIKHVYVDRRFTGEKTFDKPPRVQGDKDDFYENKRTETYQGGPKSPPYDDAYQRRYSDRSSPGEKSPGYDQENRQYGEYKRSPGRPPIINDWRREDRFVDGRKYEDRRISDGVNKVESQSPERAKDLDSSSLPVVRPVRDILGENVVPLRISEPPKTNSGRAADGSAITQRTTSSSSLASSNGTPAEVKLETTKSLIDFDDDPEPPVAPAIPQAQQTTVAQLVVMPANSGDNNWASFDVALDAKTSQGPLNVNPLESVLSQLLVPEPLPAHVSGAQGPVTGSAFTATAAGAPTISSFSTFPASDASVTSSGLTMASPLSNAGQWTSLQYQQPLFTATVSQPTIQQSTRPVGGASNNQPWNITSVPAVQGHPSTQMPHASHHVATPANEAKYSVVSQPSSVDMNSSGRNELPEDLFTVKFSSFPAPGWQMRQPPGMGISIQYNNVAPMPNFPQPSQSTNPFDVSNEPIPVQAPTFPSMSSLQGALPRLTPSATMHPSNMANLSLAWNPSSSSSYVPVLPPQAQTLASAMGPGAYMGLQMPTNMPMPRHQGIGDFGTEGAAFGFSNPDQQLTGKLSTRVTPNPFPAGGNPFG
ncbi:probable ADP-ribosylation factor GTPase-activating protein AGD14 isoform X2 [Gastrolobium bilobum]|uniref:probable ADP-ribosylation factor GTPase-activating protein AGD14 isoform X2 n=1 Tax=Gastrolobium bilobum TaxID=150636 RepID=UPI002AB18BB8|nr:probable ADP-ribosylation factor GTPase-activating protein AGD14 isoform X2 [Gastrolobium bilobum]